MKEIMKFTLEKNNSRIASRQWLLHRLKKLNSWYYAMTIVLIMLGGKLVGQNSQPLAPVFLTASDSAIPMSYSHYSGINDWFCFQGTGTEVTISINEIIQPGMSNPFFDSIFVFDSQLNLLRSFKTSYTVGQYSFFSGNDTVYFLLKPREISPDTFDYQIALKKGLPLTLYYTYGFMSGSSMPNNDQCGAYFLNNNGTPYFLNDDVEYGFCSLTNCTPDSFIFHLNSTWSYNSNYRFV